MHKHLGDSVVFDRVGVDKLHEYDIAAISCTTQDYNFARNIARHVKTKKPKIITILGGSHITALPNTLTSEFDFGCIGEGEQTLVEFVKHVMKSGSVEDLLKIDGLVHHYSSTMRNNPRAFIDPIDQIPFPFREPAFVPHLMTSRGCPYKCRFCSSSAFWKTTRFHSANYVVNEMEYLVNCGATAIPIQDDLFVAHKQRFIEITQKLKDRKLNDKFHSSINARANLITQDFCDMLKDGFPIQEVHFGAESASDRVLQLMGKNVTAAQNQKALDVLKANGIKAVCSFIVGWPTETEEELITTYEFMIKNMKDEKLDPWSSVNILTPLPGTAVWSDAVKSGIIDLNNFNWDRLGIFASYRTSNEPSFEKWCDVRRKNNSIYLNEDTVPQERLFEIMGKYELQIIEMFYNKGHMANVIVRN
jgi:radical SAM superfamily enzyme YgiQ (UPF0313 family)